MGPIYEILVTIDLAHEIMRKPSKSKINQSTQNRGKIKEQNGRTHLQEDKRTT
jgi:hypothetical protein